MSTTSIEVVLLGTGCPLPDPNRAGPATLVRAGGHALLFDTGRGVLMRTAGAGVPTPAFLSRVFLTHLHSDHITDFNDVVTMRWTMSPQPNPLPVYGPAGTAAFVERTLDMLRDDIGWRRAHHGDLQWEPECQVTEVLDGVAWEADGVRVVAAPTEHRPVHPTVGYRVECGGKAVVIAGDTLPCEGLDRLCAGADVYVQTVIRTDLVEAIPSPRLHDIRDYHSSCEDAGRTAAKAGVGKLVLTHPVPPPAPGTEAEWEALASAYFGGDVVLAHDLMTVTV
jgi:ribonuclease Z